MEIDLCLYLVELDQQRLLGTRGRVDQRDFLTIGFKETGIPSDKIRRYLNLYLAVVGMYDT